ncbi:hypothetical protein [Desmospora activa]|uniref:RsfA family transcription factor n=1 Tax=Desmospora activa DSM 45169 TaxID=1121389 RepID=A0A2T4YXE9_9BACL|nr:hypothetical protein [Desmospora activa]PTM50840.1 hypothetical protein C8J48_3787 [Desmospora activa DSM 45169]
MAKRWSKDEDQKLVDLILNTLERGGKLKEAYKVFAEQHPDRGMVAIQQRWNNLRSSHLEQVQAAKKAGKINRTKDRDTSANDFLESQRIQHVNYSVHGLNELITHVNELVRQLKEEQAENQHLRRKVAELENMISERDQKLAQVADFDKLNMIMNRVRLNTASDLIEGETYRMEKNGNLVRD